MSAITILRRNIKIITAVSAILVITLLIFKYNKSTGSVSDKENIRELYIDTNNKLSGRQIPDIKCTNSSNDSFYISDLLFNNHEVSLVYLFSELQCASCYESHLYFMRNYFNSSDKVLRPNVIIIGCFLSLENFYFFTKNNDFGFPIYFVDYDTFDWIFDEYNAPIHFVMDNNLIIKHAYIPNDIYPDINKQYFEYVYQYITNNI